MIIIGVRANASVCVCVCVCVYVSVNVRVSECVIHVLAIKISHGSKYPSLLQFSLAIKNLQFVKVFSFVPSPFHSLINFLAKKCCNFFKSQC